MVLLLWLALLSGRLPVGEGFELLVGVAVGGVWVGLGLGLGVAVLVDRRLVPASLLR